MRQVTIKIRLPNPPTLKSVTEAILGIKINRLFLQQSRKIAGSVIVQHALSAFAGLVQRVP